MVFVCRQVKYPDKTEEYLRDLVGKFEQEKLYNVFSGDVVKYLENANAKLLQVDSTVREQKSRATCFQCFFFLKKKAAMIPVPPISVDPPKISAEMSDPIYLNQRQDLTKKFLPLLSTASSKLRQLPAEVRRNIVLVIFNFSSFSKRCCNSLVLLKFLVPWTK